MEEVSVKIILAKFDDEDTAANALKHLRSSGKGQFDINNAAVIRKEENGKLRIHEDGDMDGREGAGTGALVGGAIGLLAGPLGVVAGGAIGAAVTGFVSKFRDSGLRNERLEQIGDALEPGKSILVAVVEYAWEEDVAKILQEAGGEVDSSLLPSDMLARYTDSQNMQGPDFIMKGPRAEDVDNRMRSGA
jgi:uncharacterized membrane protein